MKKYWKDGFAVAVLTLLTGIVFRWVPQTYFQQDEWYSIGQALLAKTDPSIIFHVISGVHFSPVAQVWFNIQYYLFGLNSTGFGIVSVLSHVAVIILAYLLLRTLSVRVVPAFVGIAFFALNPISSQVVTWFSASVIGGPPVLFFLLGCIIWIRNRTKKIASADLLSSLLFFCALLGKEDIITGFIVICILSVLFIRKGAISYKPVFIPFILWAVLYICIWMFGVKEAVTQHHKSISDSLFPYIALIPVWIGNIFMTHNSLRTVLQGLFGQYATYLPFIDNDPLLKTVSMTIGGVWYVWYFVTVLIKKLSVKGILLFPSLVALSTLPYYFSFSNGLESRHFYIPVLITGMWIAFYLDWLKRKKYKYLYKISLGLLALLIVVYCFANQPSNDFAATQLKRKTIVKEMQKITKPSSRTVVYFIENGAGFPFQSGPGQMLLVLQGMHDNAFVPFVRTYFLWGMFEQGYKKVGSKGFGYYFDFGELAHAYQKGLFDVSSIRAYSYDKDHLDFHDITNTIVKKIQVNSL